mmetsp:Transcript_49562/g.97994  ORF Transcript_49562/g.97994 Transcript_49562/m.97994 type:complete len:312 (-) Transcript_49562:6-941(-)
MLRLLVIHDVLSMFSSSDRIVIEKASDMEGFEKSFFAGGIAAAAAKTLTAPLERVVLIMQTQDVNPRILSGEVKRYKGSLLNCMRRIGIEQGVQALWRGNLVNVIRYVPSQAFNFAFKDTIYGWFPSPLTIESRFVHHVVAGSIAGSCSFFVAYPLDYARLRLASDLGTLVRSFRGLYDVIFTTVQGPGGLWALYRGFGVSAIGIIPYRGTYFGINDTLAELNQYQARSDLLGMTTKFSQAQLAALSATLVAFPFDTVRRRLQMQSEKSIFDQTYSGTLDCFSVIIRKEGPLALYRGAGANAIKTVGTRNF